MPESLVVFFELELAGSGASGSTLAVRIGFVTGFEASASFLSPAFLSAAAGFVSGAFADLFGAGFAGFDTLVFSGFSATALAVAGAFFAAGLDAIGCSLRGSGFMANAVANVGSVTLPPSIQASKAYRCKDNSLIYVDWYSDSSARVKKSRQEVGAPAIPAGDPSLTGDAKAASITYKGQSCKA